MAVRRFSATVLAVAAVFCLAFTASGRAASPETSLARLAALSANSPAGPARLGAEAEERLFAAADSGHAARGHFAGWLLALLYVCLLTVGWRTVVELGSYLTNRQRLAGPPVRGPPASLLS